MDLDFKRFPAVRASGLVLAVTGPDFSLFFIGGLGRKSLLGRWLMVDETTFSDEENTHTHTQKKNTKTYLGSPSLVVSNTHKSISGQIFDENLLQVGGRANIWQKKEDNG